MASEWVGVAGTAIGAGIGGVVTVVTLFAKGRQDADARRDDAARDDRLRAEDRAWALQQQNVEQRRQLYARLIRSAADLADEVDLIVRVIPRDAAARLSTARERAREALDRFEEASSEVDVAAVDARLVKLTRGYLNDEVGEVRAALSSLDIEGLAHPFNDIQGLPYALRDACRRDLGLDVPQPD